MNGDVYYVHVCLPPHQSYLALSKVADDVFPMAPNPTPTAKPSAKTTTNTQIIDPMTPVLKKGEGNMLAKSRNKKISEKKASRGFAED